MKTRRKDWTRNPRRLDSFREPGLCERCERWCFRREPHHIIHAGAAGGRRLDVSINCVGLGAAFQCACHHTYHSTRHGTAETFWRIVAKRERAKGWEGTWEDVEAAVRALLTLPRNPHAARAAAGVLMPALSEAVYGLVNRTLLEAKI